MSTFIDFIKSGQASKATALIERALNQKTLGIIKEQKAEVASDVYGTLDEELVHEAIVNPNSSKQGYDEDHKSNPYHATILKHGYEYSHSTPVVHNSGHEIKNGEFVPFEDRRIHHAYKHKTLKDHYVGVHPTKDRNGDENGHKWEVGKSGQGTHFVGKGDEKLDKHLKGHVARAQAKIKKSAEKQ
jgi:hypothetical protein